jgi:hypothetical protein
LAQGTTAFPYELGELTLGHRLNDKLAKAYLRSDMLEKRRVVMTKWAQYLAKPQPKPDAKVVDLHVKREVAG